MEETNMRCECEDLGCPHYDTRDERSVRRCGAEATQAILFEGVADGQEYCLECAQNAKETLGDTDYVEL